MKIAKQKAFSLKQLDKFKEELKTIEPLRAENQLCIYTTGSYGRYEAGKYSDMDLFFLTKQTDPISRIRKTVMDAKIIAVCRDMGLPEFSGDGEYLEIHNVPKILDELGSKIDDYHNYFTARMLLLLESKPLYNEGIYDAIIRQTVDTYYKDFRDHAHDFQPAFLVNDIIRFWRTLCLNYEYSRKKRPSGRSASEVEEAKAKSAIKNLKLKFSRKLTCYSMLLSLLWADTVAKTEVMRLVSLTPMERLLELKNNPEIRHPIGESIRLYEWFLKTTQVKAKSLYLSMSDKDQKKEAFDKAGKFGELIYQMMLETPYKNRLRYYLV